MNSVERYYEYKKVPKEDLDAGDTPPDSWPSQGKLVFENYSFRYRTGDTVLRDLSLTIEARHKVGIVGRTGAGKSSLLQALFRMEEPLTGTIYIDGVDFRTVSLRSLRSHLAIIPQDPTLFIGPLRYNLDPFNEHSDQAMWDALDLVQLKEHVAVHRKLLCDTYEPSFAVGFAEWT